MRLQHVSKGLAASLLSIVAVALSGCGANASFPTAEAVTAPDLHVMPAIQGSNYGGHAPIVGAKIFLLQVGTSGYGSKVTSLLGSTSANSKYPTALDTTSGSPTNGMYYVTSDSTGQYDLTGDYTCTAGDPVYVYGAGGNPSTNPNNGYSVTITGASAAPDVNGNLLVTFTTTGNQLLYQGETITFGPQTPSTIYGGFAGETDVVSPLNLTTNTFAVEKGPSSTTVGYASFSQTATQVQPIVNNPAIANMAVLGTCPGTFNIQAIPNGTGTTTISGISKSDFAKLAVGDTISGPGLQSPGTAVTTISALTAGSGTTTNSITVSCPNCSGGPEYGGNPAGPYYTYTVNTGTNVFNFGQSGQAPVAFVYMNEVSTVAAAFALAPFASTTANNDALHIGTSSTNLAGVQNAVLTANNLYDITGHNSGTCGSSCNGDVHIARSVTPTNTGGSVPQSLIDTIGNILANCVDSANAYGATNTSGTESAQCAALFNNATSDGTSTGTKPYDTATAALNIAKHPAGNGSTTTQCGGTTSAFACTLYNSLTGNVPFQPYLNSAPNDFSVGITYTGSGLTGANGIAIDGSGDAWVPTANGAVVELSPAGAVLSGSTGFSAGTGSNSSLAFDVTGNAWFINGFSSVMKMNSIGTLLSGAGGYSTGTYGPSGCTSASPQPHALAIDANNNVWVANYQGDDRGQSIALLNNSGTLLGAVNTNNNVCNETSTNGNTVVRNVWGIAMDGNGVMYGTGYSSENVAAVNTSTINGSFTIYNNSGSTSVPNGPAYPAIDQNGKVWMPNYYGYVNSTNTAGAGTSISVFTPGTTSASSNATTTVPYTSYSGGGLNGPQAIAVDGGNNIWVSGINNQYVSEFSNSGTALTPSTGYTGGITNTVGRLAIDGSGNLWVNSPAGNSVVQMVGVATPTLTPLVTAAKNGTPAAKP